MTKDSLAQKYMIDAGGDEIDHYEAAFQILNGPVIRANYPKTNKKAVDDLVKKIKVTKKKAGETFEEHPRPLFRYVWTFGGKKVGEKVLKNDSEAEVWLDGNIKTTLYYVFKNGQKKKSMNYIHAL